MGWQRPTWRGGASAAAALVALLLGFAASPASTANVTVYDPTSFFQAMCNQSVETVVLGVDTLNLWQWPSDMPTACNLTRNVTVMGPLDKPYPKLNFWFQQSRFFIMPGYFLRFLHLNAINGRYGNGGQIDIVGYSPGGIMWTVDVNKNQPICATPSTDSLKGYPLPANWSEFAGWTQNLSIINNYCVDGWRCWNTTIWYETFATPASSLLDSHTGGGYIMAKIRAAKTCDTFINESCQYGQNPTEKCMTDYMDTLITQFRLSLAQQNGTSSDAGGGDTDVGLAVGLAVGIGVPFLVAVAAALWYLRKRRTAAAGSASPPPADLESANGAAKQDKGHESLTHSSDSNGSNMPGDVAAVSNSFSHMPNGGNMASMCLKPGSGVSMQSSRMARSEVDMEAVCTDGTVCNLSLGPPLGQGSYGVVFKGTWMGRTVAVKVIVCDKNCLDQVSAEVRFMTALEHPNLLRAYACSHKTRIVGNSSSVAVTSLDKILRSLAASKGGSGGAANGPGRGSNATELAETWIIEEFCEFGSLATQVYGKRFINNGHVQMLPVLKVLCDVATGMLTLHERHIVHGDLKLDNVLLASGGAAGGDGNANEAHLPAASSTNGESSDAAATDMQSSMTGGASSAMGMLPSREAAVQLLLEHLLADLATGNVVAKIADFGLSKALKDGQTHHSTNTVGTITHMPPELLTAGKMSPAGDVFAFGMIMWELIAGTAPYQGLLYGQVVERIVVSQRRPDFPQYTPKRYMDLVSRCWTSDAAARPDFGEVLQELRNLASLASELQAEVHSLAAAALEPPPPAAGSVGAVTPSSNAQVPA